MRILHTGDLHIGKSVNNFSMLQDQKIVLAQMAELARIHQVQAFVIAGDIYDRAIPTAEAVTVMNEFLESLSALKLDIFIISGNHDSPERLGFAGEILEKQSIHIAGTYQDRLKQTVLQDEYGEIVFTLMPFIKAPQLSVKTSEEAVERMLADTFTEESDLRRNILVTHFFVTNGGKEPELSDSENTVAVGGLDNVDCSCFSRFCYTALGHIHKPQRMNEGKSPVVYAGAPLAYSFSECGQEKSVVLADIDGRGTVTMERLPLIPLRKMRKMKGSLEALISPEVVSQADCEDYLQVTLTDEEELIDPMGTLRGVYPNVMQLLFEKNQKQMDGEALMAEKDSHKTPQELFGDFYQLLREKEMDEKRKQVIDEVVSEIG